MFYPLSKECNRFSDYSLAIRYIAVFFLLVSSLWSQKNLEKVSLQLDYKFQYEFAGFIAAKEKGFYRDVGLDVELREYQNNIDTANDIISRKATYGIYNTSIIVTEGGKLAPVVLLGTYLQRSPLVFAVRKDIHTPADLIGKKIMATQDEFRSSSLGLMLNHFDINPNNAVFMPHTFRVKEFAEGKCDAIAVFRSNQLYDLDTLGVAYNVIDPADYGFVMSAVNLFTSYDEAIEHPQRTKRFIEATNRGWKYALDHPAEIIDILVKRYKTHKSVSALWYEYDIIKKLMMRDLYPVGQPSEELSIRTYKQLVQSGKLSSDQKLGKFMFEEVIAPTDKVVLTPAEKQYLLSKKVITMCVDPDWEPFETIKEGKHVGISADLIRLVSARIEIPIQLVPTSTWQESLALSKSGKCDILSFVNETPERKKWLTFTKPLLSDPNVLITREEHPYIADLQALRGERVVLPDGTAMLERFRKDFPNLEYIPVVGESDTMKMVSERGGDLTVRSLIVAAYIIKKEGWFNLKIAGQPVGYENHLRIGVRKDEPILRGILDKSISTISSIEREAIINKHTGLIVQEGIDRRIVGWSVGGFSGLIALIVLWNTMLRRKVRVEVVKNLLIKEQLFQSAKQAEIGNLIANISHQWREPLSKLSSLNLLTMVKLKTNQPIERDWLLEQSAKNEETIDFMSQTMQNFLEFYKRSDHKNSFSLRNSIEGSLFIVETKLLDNHIDIEVQGERSIELYAIKNEWMQVWLNLINNAIQIFIERQIENPKITISITDDGVMFCDNGGGIRETPSTSGLGLQMCRDIVTKYGGEFSITNHNDGVCAKVVLRSICDIGS